MRLHRTGLRSKTSFLLLVMVVFGPVGDVMLGKGMKQTGALTSWAPPEILHFFEGAFRLPTIWLGVASLFSFFIAYLLVLSWADYSYVQPASSLAYGVVALLGYLLLREAITPLRWAGILIICVGVFIVGHTPPRTTEC